MNGEQRITRTVERANQLVRRYLTARSDRLGVTDIEAHLLARLAAKGPGSVADIQRAFGLRASTLTNALDRLERRGLLRRDPHPGDRRTFLLSLTPAGTDAAGRVVATVDALEARVAARVTAEQLDGFRAVMAAVEEAALAGAEDRRQDDGAR
jgi:DNA-binding MarR family transcriptional regulator